MFTRISKLTIGKKLWLMSGIFITVIGVLGVTSFFNIHRLVADLNYMNMEGVKVLKNMILADMMHDGIRANAFGSIIYSGSKDKKVIDDLRAEHEEMTKNIKEYIKNVSEYSKNEKIDKYVSDITPIVDEYVAAAGDVTKLALNGDAEKAMAKLEPLVTKFEALEKQMGSLDETVEKEVEERISAAEAFAHKANLMSNVLVVVSLLFGFAFALLTIRHLKMSLADIISKLSDQYEEVNKNAVQLSAASREIARGSDQQSSALQETAAAIDEITAMAKKTNENSSHLRKSANTSLDSAHKGSETISIMLKSMDEINESNNKTLKQVESSNTRINEIVSMINEIGNKTKVINDIVFQTKLLSFNASVEAARAGEHGKGFAVVAEEVGNLAQMSGNAAKEITEMLETSISKVSTIVEENKRMVSSMVAEGKEKVKVGTEVAKKCGNALDDIVQNVSEVSRLINEIDSAISEQTTGVAEISKAVGLLDKTTHENAVISKQTSGNAEGLLSQATELGRVVDNLQQMNGQNITKKSDFFTGNSELNYTSKKELHNTEKSTEKNDGAREYKKIVFEHKDLKNNIVSFSEKKKEDELQGKTEMKMAAGSESIVPSSNDSRFEEI